MSTPALAYANDLYDFVSALDALPSPGSTAAMDLRARCRELAAAAERLRAEMSSAAEAKLRASLERVSASLQAFAQSLPTSADFESWKAAAGRRADAYRKSMREARARMQDGYEHLLASMRAMRLPDASALRSLRPKNYARNVFHVANALIGVACYEWLLDRTGCIIVLSIMLATYLSLELIRRLSPRLNEAFVGGVFKAIARPREKHQIPAAIWYTIAMIGVTAFASQTATQLALLVIGLGDPAASILGKRFGKRKLYGRKSVVGTVAFVASAALFCTAFLVGLHGFGLLAAVGISLVGAVAGGTAEVLSDDRLDDNFTVPVAAALALSLLV